MKDDFETREDFSLEDDFDLEEEYDGDDEDDYDAEDDDDLEIELTNVESRSAILTKNGMIALIGVQTFDQGGSICRVDPRDSRPAVQVYDDPEDALKWFRKSLRTSLKNGWQVVYDGLPLHG